MVNENYLKRFSASSKITLWILQQVLKVNQKLTLFKFFVGCHFRIAGGNCQCLLTLVCIGD